ncbi:MAG TPA: cytochrome C oxidase subunit IV family protein [Thermoanaerobaculia bacterium]|jgi:cytochrome c oxidase subunit 4|nr:cytochrome C oxidase subunit IV family protein [Thermoanaerobaculia bacterium]
MDAQAHAHDDHDSPEAIRRQTKLYIMVFAALMALTVITVAVSYLHLPPHLAILVALMIAGIKGSMVAAYFMHLISEKKAIYAILALTVAFFIVLMLMPSLSHWDQRMMP